MKLLVDLQAAQGVNRARGIGRFAISLTTELINQAEGWSVELLLNSQLAGAAVELRERFEPLVGAEHIHSFEGATATEYRAGHGWRRRALELVRHDVIAHIAPDVVFVPSMFEGFADGVITGDPDECSAPVVTLAHDLIPHLFPELYLTDRTMRSWYKQQLARLGRSTVIVTNSQSTAADVRRHLGVDPASVVNINGGIDAGLLAGSASLSAADQVELGIEQPYLLYVGGIDPRKNTERVIEAFALLPEPTRTAHQLVIVCAPGPDDAARLERLIAGHDLTGDVVLTPHVTDTQLAGLYAGARASILPSLYEGLGLPVLEALANGCAVIASNAGALPELIDDQAALFDPYDAGAMAAVIDRVLDDPEWRAELVEAGRRRAPEYTWAASAAAAWGAIAGIERPPVAEPHPPAGAGGGRPRLAYVSPFPPVPSGISDYSAELVPALAAHYEIETIDPYAGHTTGGAVRGLDWFVANADSFDRVVYHFGNSEYHWPMFDLLRRVPGTVVLHDFYLSGILSYAEQQQMAVGVWPAALRHSHGFDALELLAKTHPESDAVWRYPANRQVIDLADGVIVHSEFSRRLADEWYGPGASADWSVIPHLRVTTDSNSKVKRAARRRLGYADSDFVIAAFGTIGPTKLNHRLLASVLASDLRHDSDVRLVFVGENVGGGYGNVLQDKIDALDDERRFHVTGRVDGERFRQHLLAADVAVLLRTDSRGETSGTVLDAFNARTPVVTNAHGAVADLPVDVAVSIPDAFTDAELVAAVRRVRAGGEAIERIVANARRLVEVEHAPARSAAAYAKSIEAFQGRHDARGAVRRRLRALDGERYADDAAAVAASLAASDVVAPPPRPRLLVDISELALHDAGSGIQRVTRELLTRMLRVPPPGWSVEPVYATTQHGYRHARGYLGRLLSGGLALGDDEPIDVRHGDLFLGLDYAPHRVIQHVAELEHMRARGARLHFVVYDMLPLVIPQAFFPFAADDYEAWFEIVARLGDLACISAAVAADAERWLDDRPQLARRPVISHFRLGADVGRSGSERAVPPAAPGLLAKVAARPTFVMLGTLEPRKCNAQVLGAFDQLWADGVDVNLVMIGKQGWMVDALVERIRRHPELDDRLLWLTDASDRLVELVMTFSTALIAASLAEGFGLPLVEALQRNLSLIARDIPVFREVAGEAPVYFSGDQPEAVADAVRACLAEGPVRRDHPPLTTWDDSAAALLALIGFSPATDVPD